MLLLLCPAGRSRLRSSLPAPTGACPACERKKGYKIPSKKSEIEDFLNHDSSIILPMLGRLKKCRDKIMLGTNGNVDLYQADAYKELRTFIEKDMSE